MMGRRRPADLGRACRRPRAGRAGDAARRRSRWPGPRPSAGDRPRSPSRSPSATGTITVSCASAVWAEQLDLLQNELLGKLNTALGGTAEAREMRFRVAEHGPAERRR